MKIILGAVTGILMTLPRQNKHLYMPTKCKFSFFFLLFSTEPTVTIRTLGMRTKGGALRNSIYIVSREGALGKRRPYILWHFSSADAVLTIPKIRMTREKGAISPAF